MDRAATSNWGPKTSTQEADTAHIVPASHWWLLTLVCPFIFLSHLRHCMPWCTDADMQKAVKAVKVMEHLPGLKEEENKIRGLTRYNNPKTSTLAPDPTGLA